MDPRDMTKWQMFWEVIKFFGLTGLTMLVIWLMLKYAMEPMRHG